MTTQFELREVAALLDVPQRRVKGWVERGLITPTAYRRHPNRRWRLFSFSDVVRGAILLELQDVIGERNPLLKRFIDHLVMGAAGGDVLNFIRDDPAIGFPVGIAWSADTELLDGIGSLGSVNPAKRAAAVGRWFNWVLDAGATRVIFFNAEGRLRVVRQRLAQHEEWVVAARPA